MAGIDFETKITGFEDFDKLLKTLPQTIENHVLQKATLQALDVVIPDIKAAAPKPNGKRSKASLEYGTLEQNIGVRVLKKAKHQPGERGARISTLDGFWGLFYEKGTRHQPAKPFFAPSFTGDVSKIINTLAKALGDGINKAVK